jgi:hypothetical protein
MGSSNLVQRELAVKKAKTSVIAHNSKRKQFWDMLLSITILFYYFLVSYGLAFKPPMYYNGGFIAFCAIVDLMVAFDVALSFRVSIFNLITGEVINEPRHITKKRLRSVWLYIDIVSVIPFEVIRVNEGFFVLSMMKLYKIGRIGNSIQNLNLRSNIKLVRINYLFSRF